jgi:hypothetical protein
MRTGASSVALCREETRISCFSHFFFSSFSGWGISGGLKVVPLLDFFPTEEEKKRKKETRGQINLNH